jgi:hypothetical protein
MTLNQIAERIAYDKGQPFNIMLKEHIKLSVNYWRAIIMRRDVATNGMSDMFLQRFYIDLKKVDKADACNFDLDCVRILRSVNTIPRPIRLKNDTIFKFVGTVEGKPFSQVEYEEVPYTCYNRYTSKEIRFAYINDYLYIFNNTKLKKMALQYAVEVPSLINNSCTTDTCYTDDTEYPCPLDIVQQIITGIMSGEYKLLNPVSEEVEVTKEPQNGIRQ